MPRLANKRLSLGVMSHSHRSGRGLMLALVAGAAGAGVVLLAAQQRWARVSFTPPPPLPVSTVTVTGQDLVPAADALGLAALACLAAILATRGLARRGAGILLAAGGALAGIAAAASVRTQHVAAVASAHSFGLGSTTGTAPRVALSAFPWWAVAAMGGAMIVAVGLAAAWRGTRWPGMSSRYERAGAGAARGGSRLPQDSGPSRADGQAAAWEALDRGSDPTVRGRRG
jgi:uncharacterized membrane protein (TIGR02234 family)